MVKLSVSSVTSNGLNIPFLNIFVIQGSVTMGEKICIFFYQYFYHFSFTSQAKFFAEELG